MYNPFQVKAMHRKIVPPEPSHSGRRTGVTGSFKFDENI